MTRPLSGAGSMSISDISWFDLSLSLSAPPLLPSASAPTLENQVSRVTGTLTASPVGGGTAGCSAVGVGRHGVEYRLFDLGDFLHRQPAAQQVAAVAQVLGRRGGVRRRAALVGRRVNVVLAQQCAVPVVRPALEDFLLEVDERQPAVLRQLSQLVIVGFRQLRLADVRRDGGQDADGPWPRIRSTAFAMSA